MRTCQERLPSLHATSTAPTTDVGSCNFRRVHAKEEHKTYGSDMWSHRIYPHPPSIIGLAPSSSPTDQGTNPFRWFWAPLVFSTASKAPTSPVESTRYLKAWSYELDWYGFVLYFGFVYLGEFLHLLTYSRIAAITKDLGLID